MFEVSLPNLHFEAVQTGFARFRLNGKGIYDSVSFDLFSDIDEGLFYMGAYLISNSIPKTAGCTGIY